MSPSALSILPPSPAALVPTPLPSPAYVPVHRRAPVQRTLPVYKLAELMLLQNSALVQVANEVAREALKDHEFASFILNTKRRQRAAQHMQRQHDAGRTERLKEHAGKTEVDPGTKENVKMVFVRTVPSPQRRVLPGRALSGGNGRRKAFIDAASWRPVPRLSTMV